MTASAQLPGPQPQRRIPTSLTDRTCPEKHVRCIRCNCCPCCNEPEPCPDCAPGCSGESCPCPDIRYTPEET